MAITILSADCYGEPAYWVTSQLLNNFVSMNYDQGINPFPVDWREDSWKLTQIEFWHQNVSKTDINNWVDQINPKHSSQVIFDTLNDAKDPIDIIEELFQKKFDQKHHPTNQHPKMV